MGVTALLSSLIGKSAQRRRGCSQHSDRSQRDGADDAGEQRGEGRKQNRLQHASPIASLDHPKTGPMQSTGPSLEGAAQSTQKESPPKGAAVDALI